MRPAVVVELYPVADRAAGVRQALEALAMHALSLSAIGSAFPSTARQGIAQQCPERDAVLLWTVRRDELLAQAVAPHQGRVLPRREDQPVITAKKEWHLDPAE